MLQRNTPNQIGTSPNCRIFRRVTNSIRRYRTFDKEVRCITTNVEVYVRLKPNDKCRKKLHKQKLLDRSYGVEVGENFYRRNREHMIPFQSKTAVFDNLGDGKEPIESAITKKQNDDVGASEIQANLDEQPPATLVEVTTKYVLFWNPRAICNQKKYHMDIKGNIKC
jgi:hypothetical protein